ncbi:MAG TPA: hypothetical protein ENK19_09985, partial [Acidobacteria bacterium]|nr:hypothetical protein [Acidobacteriota bacterium]
MQAPPEPRSLRAFRVIGRHPWWLVVPYLALIPLAVVLLLRIPEASSLESMVPPNDPAVTATRAFRKLFSDARPAELLLETPEPFSTASIEAMDRLERAVGAIDGVRAYSLLTVWDRFRPGDHGLPSPAELRKLATGTSFFRRQGLWGPGFLGLALELSYDGPAGRDRILEAIDRAIARTPGFRVARVGSPWINAWLERQSAASTVRFFPLLGLFVVSLILFLFRSWRALLAILIPLAVSVLLGVAAGGAAGFSFTIVSGLVPLMLMVTTTASLVYLHSHFVDDDGELPLAEHRARAQAEKLLPVSASVLAAGAGFAALAVSPIPPIRQLGLWTAAGLVLGAVVCFTLYPALQVLLAPPAGRRRTAGGRIMEEVARRLPTWSYRRRWPLLVLFGLLSLLGLAALLGVPGLLAPMPLETNGLDYLDPNLPVVRDIRKFSREVLGLTHGEVWIHTPEFAVLDPDTLGALDAFAGELEADPVIGSVVGLPEVLRLRRWAAGQPEALPTDEAGLERISEDLEQLLLAQPSLRRWVDMKGLSSTWLAVTSAAGTDLDAAGLRRHIAAAWKHAAARAPALGRCSWQLVGSGVLEDSISAHLVPTLTESFAITFAIIFGTFLLIFRSGAARLNAMVPS